LNTQPSCLRKRCICARREACNSCERHRNIKEHTKPLEERIKELPTELRQEVEDFVQFLIEGRGENLKVN